MLRKVSMIVERWRSVLTEHRLGTIELFLVCHGIIQTIYVLIRGVPPTIPVDRAEVFYGIIAVFTVIRFFAFSFRWFALRMICAVVFFIVWTYISAEFFVSRLDSFSFSVMLVAANLWLMTRLGVSHRMEIKDGLKRSS